MEQQKGNAEDKDVLFWSVSRTEDEEKKSYSRAVLKDELQVTRQSS